MDDDNKERVFEIIKQERKKRSVDKNKVTKKTLIIAICLLLFVPFVIFGASAITTKGKSFLFNLDKKEEPVEEPVVEEPVPEEPEPEPPKEEKRITIVNPDSTSRPFAVMINNIGVARPVQSGLQDAYIIYEIIVEGGLTRYMALFMDQNTDRIGSIRSSRHYYLDYAMENDAIYVHHGQSPQAQRDFGVFGIDRISVDESRTGWRAKGLGVSYEHTLFTNIEKLKNGVGGKRTVRNKGLLLNYSADPVDMTSIPNNQVANSVSITYSNNVVSSYQYDSENKVYKRYVNNKEHVDWVTKQQYTFKNIITYQVYNYPLNDGENKDRQELQNVGSGTGYYISEGYAIPINWSKASRTAQTVYTYQDGSPLKVNDGNTFIQIQPRGKKIKYILGVIIC